MRDGKKMAAAVLHGPVNDDGRCASQGKNYPQVINRTRNLINQRFEG